MTTRLALALAALLAAAPSAAAQHTVALFPTTGHNVPEPQLAAAGDVLRAHLESTGRFVVVRVGPATTHDTLHGVEVGAAARDAGAELAVTLDVSRLEATGVARVAAYGPDGRLLHSDMLSVLGAVIAFNRRLTDGMTAAELSQLDALLGRLGANV